MTDKINKLHEIINSDVLKEFEQDSFNVLYDWQYFEGINTKYEDRLELDKEAYINHFHKGVYRIEQPFKESDLIKHLIDRIKGKKDTLKTIYFKNYLDFLEKKLKKRIQSKEKTVITFESLFKIPEHAKEVEKILEDNYYTKKGKWIHSGTKNTLATAYYVLSDQEPLNDIHAIKPENTTSQLRVIYKHFGLKLAEKKDNNIYSTIRNVKKRPQYDQNNTKTYLEFNKLFQHLKE